ncbi:uncharacterized protein DMAD_11926 [Drosophila madeirensis]|uniref:Uncharacterized protein n=1 Tax=Drosophila madeirensis TaxID=30013 RepID=A0AAU9FEZ6_DROMD
MNEQFCGNGAEAVVEEKDNADSANNAVGAKVWTSLTTILDLNEDCWRVVMDYLNVKDQLRLASSNLFIGEVFKRHACHQYKHIDTSLTVWLSDEDVKLLLQIVGENLVSYESDWNIELELSLLRNHCTNLQNLKIKIPPGWPGWLYLRNLKKLKSLDVNLVPMYEGEEDEDFCTDFVEELKQYPYLKELKLKAQYSGRGLDALDQLESLELNIDNGIDCRSMDDCFQKLKKLRSLRFGYDIEHFTKDNFEMLVKHCQQLERLSFNVEKLYLTVPYDLVCQLPRLQHLELFHDGSISDSLIKGLINKKGSPLESLLLGCGELPEDQVKHICNISTLKELEVECDTVPLADLLKLKNLLYLHIYMPIANDQAMDLLKGLPRLEVLNLRNNEMLVHWNLVNSVRTWMSEQTEQRRMIKIYIIESDSNEILFKNPFVEIIMLDCRSLPILINKELT